MMLTGDSMNAALNVAMEVGIVQTNKIAVLDVTESGGNKRLVWKLNDAGSSKSQKTAIVSLQSVKKMIKRQKKGEYSLVANGRALEKLLSGECNEVAGLLLRNLGSVTVIARATPDLKKSVVESLRYKGGKRVMMCGKWTAYYV
jgi:magnesium-transporting ATPase (P-type)